jgi:acetyl/propionyl-CoA carboxylase alpha subunit
MADSHGNIVYLFERECSIQRRHQKVVEEAPSSVLTPEIRKKMGEAAVNVARSCDYLGAGTVEFLVDDKLNFYFLEMNTRLQVEHPVTELITGLDLVELQILIARGEKIPFRQEDLEIRGHAIELRVYAEDSLNNFMPNVGRLNRYKTPVGKNIRVDDGYEEGMDIPIYYDPLISKLITFGNDRMQAIEMMIEAIDQYKIDGVQTTLPFGKFVMQHEAFRSGKFNTHFVKDHFSPEMLEQTRKQEASIASLLAFQLYQEDQKKLRTPAN